MQGERGVALARLGRSAEAQAVLDAAMTFLEPGVIKTRPRLLSALASTHVHQRNIEQACGLAREALGLAVQQQVEPNFQDVLRVRRELQPWATSQPVRELDAQLAAI